MIAPAIFLRGYYVARLCALLERSNTVHTSDLGYGSPHEAERLLRAAGMVHLSGGRWSAGPATLEWIIAQREDAEQTPIRDRTKPPTPQPRTPP